MTDFVSIISSDVTLHQAYQHYVPVPGQILQLDASQKLLGEILDGIWICCTWLCFSLDDQSVPSKFVIRCHAKINFRKARQPEPIYSNRSERHPMWIKARHSNFQTPPTNSRGLCYTIHPGLEQIFNLVRVEGCQAISVPGWWRVNWSVKCWLVLNTWSSQPKITWLNLGVSSIPVMKWLIRTEPGLAL